MNNKKFTYKKSGVNVKAADKFVNFISSVSSNKRGKKKFSNIWLGVEGLVYYIYKVFPMCFCGFINSVKP